MLLFSLCDVNYVVNCLFQSEPSSSAVKFNSTELRTNVLEKEAVLRFIVALAGSVTNESTSILGHQNKLWVTEHKQVVSYGVSLSSSTEKSIDTVACETNINFAFSI